MNTQKLKSAKDNMISLLEAMTKTKYKDLKSGNIPRDKDMGFINTIVGAIKELTEIIENVEVESNDT